jgi:hypothetical protein
MKKAWEFGARYLLPTRMQAHAIASTTATETARRDRPQTRPLWVYALDPAPVGLKQAGVISNVPYEPLKPGPVGARFMVKSTIPDALRLKLDWSERRAQDYENTPLDLEAPTLAMSSGLRPTTGDPRFAAQMVYAVSEDVYRTFSRALGRKPCFGPWLNRELDKKNGRTQLLLLPHAFEEDNAFYEPETGTLQFGFFKNTLANTALANKGSLQQYALSRDMICHELSHALLDGMRAHFMEDTHIDVPAFHEGFSDLIALLHHFTCAPLVEAAIEETGGVGVRALLDLGRQLGESDNRAGGRAMRSMLEAYTEAARGDGPGASAWDESDDIEKLFADSPKLRLTDRGPVECHDRGAVLVAAVMEAFLVVFRRRARVYRRLAKAMRPSETQSLPRELVELLSAQVIKLANHFLSIVIRAIDYCPPVDVRFGEYLRAMITADRDLMPEDVYDYRGALIRAFRRRGVDFAYVLDMSVDSLYWAPPPAAHRLIEIAYSNLRLSDDGMCAFSGAELLTWGNAIGQFVSHPDRIADFGLVVPKSPYGPIIIESISLTTHVSEGRVHRGLTVEISQSRISDRSKFLGGATILFNDHGEVRYVIRKRVDSLRRRKAEFDDRARARAHDGPLDLRTLHARVKKQ